MSKRPLRHHCKSQPLTKQVVQCHLCSSHSKKFGKPSAWSEDNRRWLNQLCSRQIPIDAPICRACELFIKRHTGDTGIVPRWVPKEEREKFHKCCIVEGCGDVSHTLTSIASYDVAQGHLDLEPLPDTSKCSPLALCNTHYQLLYREIRFPLPCSACSLQPRYGGDYTRQCPNPEIITSYLQQTVDFDGVLSSDSKVCKACYVFHRQVLQEQIDSEVTPSLHDIASELEEKIKQSNSKFTTDKAFLDWTTLKLTLEVVKTLQSDEAMLLPEVYVQFCQSLSISIGNYPNLNQSLKSNPPTIRWLLSCISNHLKGTLGIACKHKRYGTVLYNKKGDLLKSLSKALGTAQGLRKSEASIRHECSLALKADSDKESNHLSEETILQACTALNLKINQQIKSIVQTYQKDPFLCQSFDPDLMLQQMDPLLIQSIQILTKPTRERRQLFTHHDLHDPSGTLKSKSMKQLYCLSTLFFCTNSQCNMPLQYLMTDAILCMGGSTELVRIFNRLGAAASLDTHDRLATLVATQRINNGIHSELVPHTLTIATIDNIDIQQPNAMVSSSQLKRSWHGTSVQCVQPMPSSPLINTHSLQQDTTPVSPQETNIVLPYKHGNSSPAMSPTPKQAEKRRRTLREQTTPHTVTQLAGGKQTPADMFTNMHEYTDYQRPLIAQFTIRSFQVLPEEEQQLEYLRKSIFQYMVIKEAHSENLHLPGLPSFLSTANYSSDHVEQSNVVYVDILSLPADNKDTVLRVLDNLHNIFIVKEGVRWLLVVGDAKTYDILQSLRREYGSQLQWMLPFPGDWHILYNYQKVLLKIYGDAGLIQLAKVAGHRSETLTSLALASHFKRTHHFILQSFEAIYRTFLRQFLQSLEANPESCATTPSLTEVTTSANALAIQLSTLKSAADLVNFQKHSMTN